MQLAHRSTLVTGAGSGIGRALAVALARKGARLVLFGRRAERLRETAQLIRAAGPEGCDIHMVAGDVRSDTDRRRALDLCVEAYGSLDILVNNAGVVSAGRLETISPSDIRVQVETNLLAPILLTRNALPLLRQSGEATVVNLSSTVALVGLAFYAPYVATKAGMAMFSEALRREVYGEGIHVLTVYPNATSTPMMEGTAAGPELGFDFEPPELVADAIVEAIERGDVSVERDKERRAKLLAANRDRPAEVDARLARKKDLLEAAVQGHRSFAPEDDDTVSSEFVRIPDVDSKAQERTTH